jgi:hypothetical protein
MLFAKAQASKDRKARFNFFPQKIVHKLIEGGNSRENKAFQERLPMRNQLLHRNKRKRE